MTCLRTVMTCCIACAATSQLAAQVDFAKDIRPILSDRCFACHGPDAEYREGDLRVDDFGELTESRGDYRVIDPGNSGASELMRRITSDDPDVVMPPPESGNPLSIHQQQQFRNWIDAGAVWQKHWAYVNPKASYGFTAGQPVVEGENWIDRFIAKTHQKVGATFSSPADAITLVRRMSFDLTGLPPAVADIRAIEKEPLPDALGRYPLLAQPVAQFN